MRTVKRFEPLSVMKISTICYAVVGFLEGALFSVFFSIMPMAMPPDPKMPRFIGVLFGGFAIIFFPIFSAIMGAIFGGLGALIYNLAARYVGGIQVEVE